MNFASLSRWVLTFNNQIISAYTYLISHQIMSIRLKIFLQCFCDNKSRHLSSSSSIPIFHSFSSSSDGFPNYNLFFVDKPFGSNSNDLYNFRNKICKIFEYYFRILEAGFLIIHTLLMVRSNWWISKIIYQFLMPVYIRVHIHK